MEHWLPAARYPGDTLIRASPSGREFELTPDGWEARSGNAEARAVQAVDVIAAVGEDLAEFVRRASLRRLRVAAEAVNRAAVRAIASDREEDLEAAMAAMAAAMQDIETLLRTTRQFGLPSP
jgi:hypothetical protein